MDGMTWPPPARGRKPLSLLRERLRALGPGEGTVLVPPPGMTAESLRRRATTYAHREWGRGQLVTRVPDSRRVLVWRRPAP